MVGKLASGRLLRLFLLCISVIFALLLAGGLAPGSDEAEEEPTMWERITVTMHPLGDADVVNTVKYPEDVYDQLKKIVEEYPNFLTRRYVSEDKMKEVEKLKTRMDDSENSVTLSYHSPGYAYDYKDYWALVGYSKEPDKKSKNSFTFESQRSRKSDFTLYTRQYVEKVVDVKLPEEATGAHYDHEENSIVYRMPQWQGNTDFFSENKTLLTVLFGILSVLFAGLFVLYIAMMLRSRKPAVATSVPAPAETETSRKKETNFCSTCGETVEPGKKFCTMCGAPL